MTRFLDGPAEGKSLMLRRAVRFLRVTNFHGIWDALDQPEDKPHDEETIHAYECVQSAGFGTVHVRGTGVSGMYSLAHYRYVEPQPEDGEMRTNGAWRAWTRENAGRPKL